MAKDKSADPVETPPAADPVQPPAVADGVAQANEIIAAANAEADRLVASANALFVAAQAEVDKIRAEAVSFAAAGKAFFQDIEGALEDAEHEDAHLIGQYVKKAVEDLNKVRNWLHEHNVTVLFNSLHGLGVQVFERTRS